LLNYEIPSAELDYWPVFSIRARKERPDGKLKNEEFAWEALPEINA
jgi:hypothetical protein